MLPASSCRHFALGVLVASGLSCADTTAPVPSSSSDPIDLSVAWVTAPPTAEGVDAAKLSTALGQAATIPGLRSILVVRHGHLIAEQYFSSGGPDSLYGLRSVTKSVMSLLVGIAIQRGIVQSTDEPLGQLFHPPLPTLDPPDAAITIGDLLTMTGGFQWDEASNVTEYNNWALAPDQLEYLLARPIVNPPGTVFNYNSAAVHLLSAVLQIDAGGTAAFADSYLLAPLGIHARDWELDDRGIPNGGAGLYLQPKDMAKIGQLVLQDGRSGSAVVVARDWIETSTSPQIQTGTALGAFGALRYGNLWWLGSSGGRAFALAWGYGGQFIWIVPDLDLVVVTTATWQGLGGGAEAQAAAIAAVLVNGIAPSVH